MKPVSYIQDFNTWVSEFNFSTPIKIRFSETDLFGHVNNVSPFIYFEEARIEFLKEYRLFGALDKSSKGIPVVSDLQCDYHYQMYFGDRLDLFVKVNSVGTTSLDLHYMGKNQDGKICLTGRGRVVQIDPETGKTLALTDAQKEKISSYL